MPENRPTDCERFEDRLGEAGGAVDAAAWDEHLTDCASCRAQWTTHRLLVATLADEPVPQLSSGFDAGLEHKLVADVEVRPLSGWRILALGGYAAGAAALMGWILERYPLPEISIDLSDPWLSAAAFLAAPITLWLAAAASRFLPSRSGKPELLGL